MLEGESSTQLAKHCVMFSKTVCCSIMLNLIRKKLWVKVFRVLKSQEYVWCHPRIEWPLGSLAKFPSYNATSLPQWLAGWLDT
jgi:hypothetical protein